MRSLPGTVDHAADLKLAVVREAMVPKVEVLRSTSREFQVRATPLTTEPASVQPPSCRLISQYTRVTAPPTGCTSYSPDASDACAACSALQLANGTQLPATHVRAEAHALPHAPQLSGSVWRFLHDPLHAVCPDAQLAVHAPPVHTCPSAQAVPQRPQLALSTAVSRHTPEHTVCPGGHDTTHTLFVHTCPAPQAVPHDPQFDGSMRVSAQRDEAPVPHRVKGEAQSSTQRPIVQTLPDGHIVPHAPQLSRSLAVDTQRPPQAV